mmetsp:Transcript_29795/g.70911  ORF Transcript_29795/g.70911 Transcript_29795/m.70911 type:complete len:488 (+) Transcript_29795:425-1888(+)
MRRIGSHLPHHMPPTSELTLGGWILRIRFFQLLHILAARVEGSLEFGPVQLPLHDGHHHCSNGVAADVGQRPALGHELVDAQHHGHARDQLWMDHAQGGRQGDEAGARDPGCTLGGEHRHHQDLQLLRQGQLHAHGLADEERGERHVDVGAVQVEGVAQGYHQADHGLGDARGLQLLHQRRKGALRGAGGEHQQQLRLDVEEEPEDVEATNEAHRAQHHEDETNGGHVIRGHQAQQVLQCADAVLPHREGHGAKGAERGKAHDNAHHTEHGVRNLVHQLVQNLHLVSLANQSEAKEQGEEEHLQDFALREGAHHSRRDDIRHKVQGGMTLAFLPIPLSHSWVDLPIHAVAWLHQLRCQQADQQRYGGDHLEVQNGEQSHAPHLGGVRHVGDAADHRAEDDGGNDHLHHLHKELAHGLDPGIAGHLRGQPPKQDPNHNGHQDLGIERESASTAQCAHGLRHGSTVLDGALLLRDLRHLRVDCRHGWSS